MSIYQGNNKISYSCNVDNSVYSVPIGTILSYTSTTPPTGFLVCDGSEVSKTTYADLYTIIGDTYGTSTDAGKFKLPDLRDKFIQGANGNLGTSKEAGLPDITGDFIPGSVPGNHTDYTDGAFTGTTGVSSLIAGKPDLTVSGFGYNFSASRSNSIYGNSDTVQPNSLCLVFIIKALKVSDKYTEEVGALIDDTSTATDKVWSAKKVNDAVSNVNNRMELVCAEYKTAVSDANTYISYQAKGKCQLVCDYANITHGNAVDYVFVYIGNNKLPEGTGIYKIDISSAQKIEINIEQNVTGKLMIYANYNV